MTTNESKALIVTGDESYETLYAVQRMLTAYEPVRAEIEMGGGSYFTRQAVRDGNIVTGQTWQSHPEFNREIFACLNEVLMNATAANGQQDAVNN